MNNEAEELRRELEWLYSEYNKVLEANSGLEKEVHQLTLDKIKLNKIIDEISADGWYGR